MKISLNGKQVEVKSRTLELLIPERGLHPDALIVEVNSELIKKEHWAKTIIREGDTLELLNFVGGG
ncbi:MAG: sulfur carrier protein ThiS [Desulfobulbaceae bacterium]|nr:sulfur carrier protein ThiS [Desulfobulbaceae bacterium]